MQRPRLGMAFAVLLLLAGNAFAQANDGNATLREVRGAVSVRDGNGSQAGQSNQGLLPGQRVDAAASALANIEYNDGCDVRVESNKFAIVGRQSPCACAAGSRDASGSEPASGDAILRELAGRVSLNQGSEFQLARDGQGARPGDRVMVSSQSRAVLEFADGCRIELNQESLVEVPRFSPCACGALVQQSLRPGAAATAATGAATNSPALFSVPFIAAGVAELVLDHDASP